MLRYHIVCIALLLLITPFLECFIAIPPITAYEKNGLTLKFEFDASTLQVNHAFGVSVTASNSLSSPMTDFVFQAAVPKVGVNPQILDQKSRYTLDQCPRGFPQENWDFPFPTQVFLPTETP